MAVLTTKSRKALPDSDFAGPNRTYPIQDRAHAADAKARAVQQYRAGNISRSVEEGIIAKANRKLGE